MFKKALLLLIAPAAFGLNNRSAVSVNGNDLNPCTVASPCRSFGVAIAQTNPGGEIIALDSAGYGPFTITGTFTVSGAPGVHAAITATSGNGITINAAATDRITVRNLVLIGSGADYGILQQQAAEVRILNCLVRGFNHAGIDARSGRMSVDHSSVLDQNGEVSIGIGADSNGTDAVQMTIGNSLIQSAAYAVFVGGRASAMVSACNISGSGYGVYVTNSAMDVPARATLESSTIAYNLFGIGLAALARVYISQNEISYNSIAGVSFSAPSSVYSFNNTRFTENAADGGPFLSISFQ